MENHETIIALFMKTTFIEWRSRFVVVSVSSGDGTSYNIEEGNAAAGVVEFKNNSFAIDQTIAEMIKTAGNLALSVLASKKQLNTIIIIGIAANYKTQEAKLIKITVNLVEETSEIVQSSHFVMH